MAKYITDTGGMPRWAIELIDGLLPIAAGWGDPREMLTKTGRPDIAKIQRGSSPHTHTTGAAAEVIMDFWLGRGELSKLLGHADTMNRHRIANALRACADALEGITVLNESTEVEQ